MKLPSKLFVVVIGLTGACKVRNTRKDGERALRQSIHENQWGLDSNWLQKLRPERVPSCPDQTERGERVVGLLDWYERARRYIEVYWAWTRFCARYRLRNMVQRLKAKWPRACEWAGITLGVLWVLSVASGVLIVCGLLLWVVAL